MRKIYIDLTGLGVVSVLLFTTFTPYAQAALISDEQITKQNREVFVALVETLRQDLKLLQMIYIQRLEVKLDELQSLT